MENDYIMLLSMENDYKKQLIRESLDHILKKNFRKEE